MKNKITKNIKQKKQDLLRRRPHRSFKLTKKRDYKRPFNMPGVFAFTKEVNKILWKNKKVFFYLIIFYVVTTILMVGLTSEDTYQTLSDTISNSSSFFNSMGGTLVKSGLLFLTAISGGISDSLTDVQKVYAGLIMLITILTSIWLLRNIMAGYKVKLRDGLYNSSSPIISIFIVILLMLVQLIPIAIVVIGFSAAVSTNLLSGGVEAMLFWIAAAMLTALSLYWIISTFFALIIVTIPGMYPSRAIRVAGDIVVGRRTRIFLRVIWMLLTLLVLWFIVLFPIILLDAWIKSVWAAISWMPTIPIVISILTAFTIIWSSAYIYLFYRRIVDDESESA